MGPLAGVRIIEMAGIGPGPFCGMMLSDMGAEVIRVDRKSSVDLGVEMPRQFNVLNRGRRSIALDLKTPEGIAAVKRIATKCDALIEGFRPGVMERLGLGPDELLRCNSRLVYGRITGWGQTGPVASAAGHDINYISLTGMLHAIGRSGPPSPPLNLVGDFGGGAMYLAFGVVCALLEARSSGKGQVVDAAMVDGAASLGAAIFGLRAAGIWNENRADNILDSGAPWYDVYETADGKYISIGSIEERFFNLLLEKLDLRAPELRDRDRSNWPRLRTVLTDAFRTRTRADWCKLMEGSDICFAPVLTMDEAPVHAHMQDRGVFCEIDGVVQPGPAPRFSRTKPEVKSAPSVVGEHTDEILTEFGFSDEEIGRLNAA
ncbi:MAG: alpha-methylacyl-CoA racemase [Gammaproteobacteria bacterium]|nr:alpha-methylacyl-CoA racemase [Gammaproteobacteria bacterium]